MRRPSYSRAFTLAEALAALVLVAVVIPAVMRAVSIATGIAGVATDRLTAIAMAESKIEQLVAEGEFQETQMEGSMAESPSGSLLDDAQIQAMERFDWTATLEPWTDATLNVLTVTVSWQRRGAERSVSVSTLVAAAEAQP